MTAMRSLSYDAVVLDIEGTTTSIAFVYDELFPYAREALAGFVRRGLGTEAMQSDVEALRQQAELDVAAGEEGVPSIGADLDGEALVEAVCANVLWQMDNDRKTTALKGLQGRIWKDGYASGTLKGHVFDDVPPALERWAKAQIPVYIYSSGSVAAQKLLFGASVAGDLLPQLARHFDTTFGSKKEASSYVAIAEATGHPPERLLFVTDHLAEAHAAYHAGWQVVVSVRPGNASLAPHAFLMISSFEALVGT